MLSERQQRFIVMLLKKNLTRSNNTFYKSRAFYRSISYLKKNNVVKSKKCSDKGKGNMNEYYLTIKGTILAKLLAGFEDADPEIRERYGLT